MSEALAQMLQEVSPHNAPSVVRDTIQKIILLGLWRAKFFEKGLCTGDTALRHAHGIDLFCERMTFSTLKPSPNFKTAPYLRGIKTELNSYGCDVVFAPTMIVTSPRGEQIHSPMKLETQPQFRFETSAKLLLQPIPFSIKSSSIADLLLMTIHKVLQEGKARDWYELAWLVRKNASIPSEKVEQRFSMDGTKVKEALLGKVEHCDLQELKALNPNMAESWSSVLLHEAVNRIAFI
ncbi:MAG: hypothetical protein H7A37_10840 [Chlamydiales bacterium]|nr:hypothetical protein [Chlamydiia bacterium]MCP5508775.1 hypothetical protein [Chlamydiales bacterium]